MEELILSKYQKHCENNSIIMQQPSGIEVKRKYAYLFNSKRIIARYVLKTGKFI
jgi:hypothetical protein|nr:MAG TPA: hypothetical protein [Caudoviricetes sp.]